jgi:transposase
MSAKTVRPIPEDTASAGKAFFKKGTFYRSVGDRLDDLCEGCEPDSDRTASEPHVTIPLLFLITVFQYLENLSDSQAAAAVLNRVDWKYALHLPLISLGFDQKELEQYHRKLLTDPKVLLYLDGLLERVRDLYDSPPRDPEKVDTTSMLDAVRALNRLSQVVRAMRLALDELAIYHPDWLKKTVLPHWFQRYAGNEVGGKSPETRKKREALALAVGEDGFFLLDALGMDDAPRDASSLPEVEYFRHVWNLQFERVAGRVNWRTPPAAGARRSGSKC